MRKSFFGRSAAALCLILASLSAIAGEPCTASKLEMPVRMIGTQPIVKIGINGTQVPMLLDSGAFYSSLSPAAASQLKLKLGSLPFDMTIQGVTGEMDAQLTTVEHMQLLGGEIPNIQFIVGGNEDGSGAMGIVGRNLLTLTDIEFDLANGMVRLFFPKGDCSNTAFAYWADDKPFVTLPLLREDKRNKRPAIRAIAEVNGEKIKVLFDTGAANSMLTLSAAKRAGVREDQMKPNGRIMGVGRGTLKSWLAALDSFALGEEKIRDVRVGVADMAEFDAEMLVGADFFLAHRIYISKQQRKMYFTYNGGPVFAQSAQAAAPANAQAPAESNGEPPLDAAAYARRGAASAGRRDFTAALADLDRAVAMAPDQPDLLVQRGVIHQELGEPREARKDFDAAILLDPKQPEALLRRASLQPTRSGRDAALADLHTLDTTLPAQANERLRMAVIYERFDEPRQALAQLTQWIASRETDVSLPQVQSMRCTLRTQLGVELDEALADCDSAVRAYGKDFRYRENRGLLRLKRGEPDRALTDFDKALELKPDAPWALYGRSIVERQRGQAEASRADLEAARKLRPQVDTQLAKFGLPAPG